MDNLLTAKQVQDLLNLDRTTIYRMLKDGRLAGIKVGQHWRFSAREVNDILSKTTRINDTPTPLAKDALPLHCMQPIQDIFAEVAQIGAVITDLNGKTLTHMSNSCDFCKLMMGSVEGRAACMASWKKLADQQDATPGFRTCHAGLQYARSQIKVQGELLAILVAGQFHAQEPGPEEETQQIETLARKYHINKDLLTQAAKQISVLDEHKVSQIGGWLVRVVNTFEQISSERTHLMGRLRQIAEMSVIEK